jgi:hypothetical protein
MRVMHPGILVVLATTLTATALPAQAMPISPTPAVLSASAEVRLGPSPFTNRQVWSEQPDARKPSKRTGEILMIVGGAGLLVGLLANEGVIAIAGAAVGGYGLYVYLDADKRR